MSLTGSRMPVLCSALLSPKLPWKHDTVDLQVTMRHASYSKQRLNINYPQKMPTSDKNRQLSNLALRMLFADAPPCFLLVNSHAQCPLLCRFLRLIPAHVDCSSKCHAFVACTVRWTSSSSACASFAAGFPSAVPLRSPPTAELGRLESHQAA